MFNADYVVDCDIIFPSILILPSTDILLPSEVFPTYNAIPFVPLASIPPIYTTAPPLPSP